MIASWVYNKYKAKKAAKEEEKRAAAASNAAVDPSVAQNAQTTPQTEQRKH